MDAKIFIPDSNLVPSSKSNQFYKITDDRIGIHVNEEIVIGGRVVRVLKIMAMTSGWLNNNYFYPMERINNRYENRPKTVNCKCSFKCCCKYTCAVMIGIIILSIILHYAI